MRKTKTIIIPGTYQDEPGFRDNGKKFLLTEMASRPAEKWADRAFLALAHSRADLPSGRGRGMAWIEQVQRLAGHIHFPELEPLMDEIMACVQRIEPGTEYVRPLIDLGTEGDDIEEVSTRHFLRSEVIALHVGFSLPAVILNWIAAGSTMTFIPGPESSETTPTSPPPLAQSSRRGSRRLPN